nr:DNA internalization-related competence protein ComEC/Rec2 [Eubacterium sp.]
MIRRPMLAIFLLLVLGIIIWQKLGVGAPELPDSDINVQCQGQVEQIQVKPSGQVFVLADVEMVADDDKERVEVEKVIVYNSSDIQLFSKTKIGNIVKVAGSYSAFQRATNPGEFNQYEYYRSMKVSGSVFAEHFSICDDRCLYMEQGLFEVRQMAMKQLRGLMTEEDAGVLGAMILGEKSGLLADTKDLYQQTGIGHILAISGLHISMLGVGVFSFLRKYLFSLKKSVIVTVLFLFVYGQLTGFPVATTRAVIMLCCRLLARYSGRTYDVWSALAFSGIVILIQEPLQLFQCGFLLSYAAIAGIHLFEPIMEVLKVKNRMIQSVISSGAFFVVTLPVMLWFFYEVCPYTVVVNLVVLPVLSLLIGLGILGCVVSFVWHPGGEFLLATSHYILKYYKWICEMTTELPFSRIVIGRPSVVWMVMYYLILLGVILAVMCGRKKWYVYAGAFAVLMMLGKARPQMEFMYTQLDVGQGDCACIMHGESTYLIDGGSTSEKEIGKYVLERFLKFYGRQKVDVVFVTHSDADHINGILELVERREKSGLEIESAVVPEIEKKDENYISFLTTLERYDTNVYTMKKGDACGKDKLSFSCLHPAPDYEWESENDYSLTLDISYKDFEILATGDLEETGEGVLQLPRKGYDVLKVGHHGSKTSTSQELLDQVNPQVALISCGKNNRYGHPAPEVVERLEKVGSQVMCTTEQGAIMIEVGEEIGVYGYGK